jgi:polyvinyl alcohol dehydrogenase (cytochrome)
VLLLLAGTEACSLPLATTASSTHAHDDWPMYGYSLGRSGFNALETAINPESATRLTRKIDVLAGYGTLVTAEPAVADGLIYWGSWDGIEHATRPDGSPAWKTDLGMSPLPAGCTGGGHSLLGSAALSAVGHMKVLFVGGGNAVFYALDAGTGRILWRQQLAAAPADIWSSPVVYDGSVYTSTAGFGDCPGVQGQVFQLDEATGAVQHTFDVVPTTCIGGGIWGSPAIDVASDTLYVATGNEGPCQMPEPYATAIVQLRAADLSFVSAWQLPLSERVDDSDFGATPVLFDGTINGDRRSLLGLPNKNGVFYAFDESRIAQGPVWRTTIAKGGISPESGDGSISSAAWDGTRLYVGGGRTEVSGQACAGSVRALDPASGDITWETCINDGAVIAALSAAPGVIIFGAGKSLTILASSSGRVLARLTDTDGGFNLFYGGAAIADGAVYIGNANGTLLAYVPG